MTGRLPNGFSSSVVSQRVWAFPPKTAQNPLRRKEKTSEQYKDSPAVASALITTLRWWRGGSYNVVHADMVDKGQGTDAGPR